MAPRTAPRVSRDVSRKKTAGKKSVGRSPTLDAAAEYSLKDFLADVSRKKTAGKKSVGRSPTLDAAAEYSLKDFLADEPDLYSVSDIKVRYR